MYKLHPEWFILCSVEVELHNTAEKSINKNVCIDKEILHSGIVFFSAAVETHA